MNTEIWNSSQMAGSGGALKALAKNLANQLNLNRTEMKRVVARVISERHGHGDVGDYNGHMFFVKPDQINLTEQITHSKEAFDEMITQKQMLRSGLKNQMPKSRSRLLADNKPNKSSMINQQHMSSQGNSSGIKPKIISTKSKPQIKRKPQSQNPQCCSSQMIRQPKPSKSLIKPKSVSKLAIQGKPKLLTTKKKELVKSEAKSPTRKPLKIKRPLCSEASGSNVKRLDAGKVIQQEISKPNPQDNPEVVEKKVGPKKKKSVKKFSAAKSRTITKKTWQEPWQNTKKITPHRLRAGSLLTKPRRIIDPVYKRRFPATWHNPYQFLGGAGATRQPNANQCSKSKFGSRINRNKFPSCKNNTESHFAKTRQNQSQIMSSRELEREEAIDDPDDRLVAGSMLKGSLSTHSRKVKRKYKLSARLEELAKPVFRLGKPSPAKMSFHAFRSHSPIRKPKMKTKSRRRRRRVYVNSSLGSIAGLKGTSATGLTPAKRHLTLAFMNKDTVRSPRRSRSVMWR